MLIEFIKNPDFKAPQPPPIRVGSVVRTATDNYKGVVAKIDWQSNYSLHVRLSLYSTLLQFRENSCTVLPEKVSGVVANTGEWEYAPLDPPPPSFSWADYPPKAGMVVEGTSSKDKYVLFGVRGIGWTVIHGKGERDVVNWSDGDVMEFYLPRPDLMPRFVTEGRR